MVDYGLMWGGCVLVKLVSVIIPVYNSERYIRACLDSVLSQSLEDMEVVCIDDGSFDSSKEIIRGYLAADRRVQLLEQENRGAAAARNRGIQHAQGEFLAFMDADDLYPEPATLQKLYQAAREHEVSVCGGSMGEFKTSAARVITSWDDPYQDGYTFKAPGLIAYADYQFDFGWTRFIYKRSLLIDQGIQQPECRYFEDPPFFVEALFAAGCFYAIPDITYLYRWNAGKNHALSSAQAAMDALAGVEHNIRFAHDKGYQRLFSISVHRLCDILELIDTNDLTVVNRQLEILDLLGSYPEAQAQTAQYAKALQWQFMDEKRMLSGLKLTRVSLFMARLRAYLKRRLGHARKDR